MGFDKLLNFINHNTSQDTIEDINIKASIRKILTNHVMFDISFVIYQSLIDVENEINSIIKIISSLPFSLMNPDAIEKKILEICIKLQWTSMINNIHYILDGENETYIIKNFINYIRKTNITEEIIINKINNKIIDWINSIHVIDLIKTITIVFDGIPSYSKILEQRRRRIKNYLESKERKSKLNDLDNSYYSENGITINFLKSLKYYFRLEKSFGPLSNLTVTLEKYLFKSLSNEYKNIKININSGKNNGEADYKIFYEIYKNNYEGNISIHTIDSDLVHQIIIQQNYFNLIKKDIHLSVIKYNNKDNQYIQYINGQQLNKKLLSTYSFVNGINSNNLLIIYDIALLFYFFGNDHLPCSNELGPEISLDYYSKIHYKIFKNSSLSFIDTIIKINDNNITINFENFKLFLKELYKNNEFNKTKVILSRYFKISYQLIIYLTDKLKLSFDKILLLCKKILYDNGKTINDLDETDIRYKLINKYDNVDYPFNINTIDINEFKINMTKLLSILDTSQDEDNYYGLPLYVKYIYFIENKYENIYNYINEFSINQLIKKYPIIYDNVLLTDILREDQLVDVTEINNNIESYLKKIYHLIITLFGNMTLYNPNNFTYFKGYNVPSLGFIINFLETNDINTLTNKWSSQIETETTISNKYFNTINHHLIITPYIKEILYKFKTDNTQNIIKNINIKNFWFDNNEDFNYKDFNLDTFINNWMNKLDILLYINVLEIEL